VNLCSSYINLADRFQQLDVEHMTLKGKVVPLLKSLKSYRQKVASLMHDKQELQDELILAQENCKVLMAKNEALKPLEPLLGKDIAALLAEATEQSELVDETIAEIETNCDPDLSDEDKALLTEFYANPEEFVDPDVVGAETTSIDEPPAIGAPDASSEVVLA
ncbi:MAG: hypothetical protein F6K09_23510, partial [Merismopedia sp. SIO2A8]|nr:hypothetical protein [Merismopedia sp. SIO2A8]